VPYLHRETTVALRSDKGTKRGTQRDLFKRKDFHRHLQSRFHSPCQGWQWRAMATRSRCIFSESSNRFLQPEDCASCSRKTVLPAAERLCFLQPKDCASCSRKAVLPAAERLCFLTGSEFFTLNSSL